MRDILFYYSISTILSISQRYDKIKFSFDCYKPLSCFQKFCNYIYAEPTSTSKLHEMCVVAGDLNRPNSRAMRDSRYWQSVKGAKVDSREIATVS